LSEQHILSSQQARNEVIRRIQQIPCDGKMEVVLRSVSHRTNKQNNALHKFCELLAIALNDAGLDMKKTLKPDADIPWTKELVKEYIWKPVQKAAIGKKSTTEMSTLDPSQVYEIINRHMSEKHGISVPFPSEEEV
jgi:hypothetical protein